MFLSPSYRCVSLFISFPLRAINIPLGEDKNNVVDDRCFRDIAMKFKTIRETEVNIVAWLYIHGKCLI